MLLRRAAFRVAAFPELGAVPERQINADSLTDREDGLPELYDLRSFRFEVRRIAHRQNPASQSQVI